VLPKTLPAGRGIKLLAQVVEKVNAILQESGVNGVWELLPLRGAALQQSNFLPSIPGSTPVLPPVVTNFALNFRYQQSLLYQLKVSDADIANTLLTIAAWWGKKNAPHALLSYLLCTTVNLIVYFAEGGADAHNIPLYHYSGGNGASLSFTFRQKVYVIYTYLTFAIPPQFTYILCSIRDSKDRNGTYKISHTLVPQATPLGLQETINSIIKAIKGKKQKATPIPSSAYLHPRKVEQIVFHPLNAVFREWGLPPIMVDYEMPRIYPPSWVKRLLGDAASTEIDTHPPLRLGFPVRWGNSPTSFFLPLLGNRIGVIVYDPSLTKAHFSRLLDISHNTLPHLHLYIIAFMFALNVVTYLSQISSPPLEVLAPPAVPTSATLPTSEAAWGAKIPAGILASSKKDLGELSILLPDVHTIAIVLSSYGKGDTAVFYLKTQEVLQGIYISPAQTVERLLNLLLCA